MTIRMVLPDLPMTKVPENFDYRKEVKIVITGYIMEWQRNREQGIPWIKDTITVEPGRVELMNTETKEK